MEQWKAVFEKAIPATYQWTYEKVLSKSRLLLRGKLTDSQAEEKEPQRARDIKSLVLTVRLLAYQDQG